MLEWLLIMEAEATRQEKTLYDDKVAIELIIAQFSYEVKPGS